MISVRPRILYLLREFPQISQTYIKNELHALGDTYDIRIITLHPADIAEPEHRPFTIIPEYDAILAAVREFKPALIHTHYMIMAHLTGAIAMDCGLPFTVRSHSFDILETASARHEPLWLEIRDYLRGDNCLGVLCFPFLRDELEQFGVPAGKLVDVPPVISFEHFHDRSPNGKAIMNMGAVRPKKRMRDFVDLSAMLPGMEFNLYAMGYNVDKLREYSVSYNAPVNFIPPVPHSRMPTEYKRHQWLVYTASADIKSVGWPMAVAEAQAAGVGVCLADIRPDLRDYVGTAGYLYRDLGTVRELISGPVPMAIRQAAFEQARRSDIREHIHKLTDLWAPIL
jgi:glycosyltransferase involved in cell wall biosynthesis